MTITVPAGPLPPLYARWAAAFLPGPLPIEERATCDDCAMRGLKQQGPGAIEFHPVTKCCTYLPELWNYLVGGILDDDDPALVPGRQSVGDRIAGRDAVTPLGLGKSRRYTLLYQQAPDGFGRAESMRCPHHLDDGRCGVWRHRESTCATWYCKHERGEVGLTFWRRMRGLLRVAEAAVARHAILELDIGAEALARLYPAERPSAEFTAAEVNQAADPAWRRAVWGRWHGREPEFFRRAGQVAAGLAWADVVRLGGGELELQLRLLRESHARLRDTDPPARPRAKPINALPILQGYQAVGYSNFDPLLLAPELYEVLGEFDGRPLDQSLEAIRAKYHRRLTPALVRKLADFGVLEEEQGVQE